MQKPDKHDWVYEARCIGLPTDMFFPAATPESQVLKICGLCPVRQACLQAALEEEELTYRRYGVRGGLNARERARLAKGVRNANDTYRQNGA